MASAENRRNPRITRAFMVRYRPLTHLDFPWLVSPLKDLSSGGARFISERRLEVGDMLELQLLLPASSQPVVLKARVAWVKSASFKLVQAGVTFDCGDATIQQMIDGAVAHFLKKTR